MKKHIVILTFMLLASVMLIGCNSQKRSTTAAFFDGTVTVERVRADLFNDDEINITFLKEGTYDIAYYPVNPGDRFSSPQGATVVVESVPITKHFESYSISDVRVTITINGNSESQNLILE